MKTLLCIGIFLCFVTFSFGAPTVSGVSGDLTDGSSVTISGSSFGSKSTAAPLIWDTFEDGDVSTTATVGTWTATNSPSLESSTVYDGSYGSSANIGSVNFTFTKTLSSPSDGEKIYVYLCRQYSEDVTGENQKFLRIWPPSGNYPNLVASWNAGGLVIVELVDSTRYFPGDPYPPEDTWFIEEFVIQLSSGSGQADGIFTYTRDGDEKASYTNLTTRDGSYPQIIERIVIDNFGDLSGFAYMDNIYVDNSWSRVMLANNSSLASATVLEIQPPTAWSATSITVTFNSGSFNNNDTAYIFVFDSANDNNTTGYEITIGPNVKNQPSGQISISN